MEGDLLVETKWQGGKIKSVLQILIEATFARPLAQWAAAQMGTNISSALGRSQSLK